MNDHAVELYYQEVGKGTPVVLLHGFPLNHTIWQPLAPLLQDQARLILPDLRGYGQSPVTEGGYSMRELADDVLALLDRLKIEHTLLVGHSMGGYVALAFAQAYPHRLTGLGFVSTHAAADLPEVRQGRLIGARKVAQAGVNFLAKDMSEKITARPGLVEPLRELMAQAPKQAVIGSLKGMAERPDSTGFLSLIHAPAVVVHGDEDRLVSLERARTMAELLPRGWLVEIPHGGHMLMMEAPGAVAAALGELIQASAGYRPQ